jgi:succinate dehydrogenase (ubiquinone) cytochrome b560 subunit
MLRNSSKVVGLLKSASNSNAMQQVDGALFQQLRFLGGDKVPEFWGKPSPYTDGTDFLGTPKNHMELVDKRPLSPDVFEVDSAVKPHYKFPYGAITSITNRVTGVVLTTGFAGAGAVSIMGDLPATINALASTSPMLLVPLKFAIAFNIIFHYAGALRHFAWDHHKIGSQTDKKNLLEPETVERISKIMLASTVGISAVIAFL